MAVWLVEYLSVDMNVPWKFHWEYEEWDSIGCKWLLLTTVISRSVKLHPTAPRILVWFLETHPSQIDCCEGIIMGNLSTMLDNALDSTNSDYHNVFFQGKRLFIFGYMYSSLHFWVYCFYKMIDVALTYYILVHSGLIKIFSPIIYDPHLHCVHQQLYPL